MKNTAQSYAAALYELAREEKEEKKILDDLSVISAVFKAEEKYLKLLNSYAVEKSEKDKLANDAFGGKLSGYSVNFIKLLASKNILNLIFDCEKEYARLYRKAHNIERASIISAVELSDVQKENLVKKLEKMTGKTVCADFSCDSGIIGGLVVRFENSQLDLSVKSRREDMKKHIFYRA